MRIGIDLMGSDNSPLLLFKAVEHAANQFPQARFVVFLTQVALDEILVHFPLHSSFNLEMTVQEDKSTQDSDSEWLTTRSVHSLMVKAPSVVNHSHSKDGVNLSPPTAVSKFNQNGIEFKVTSDSILMDDEPLIAIRQKKNSSLVMGLKYLRKGDLDGFVSAGNTGALIAGATLSLPLLPGIKRPALLAVLPTERGKVAIIDVGGNVSCKAYHLAQFGQLGIAYQRCREGIARPRIGLLNIGVESKKGTSEVRQAYEQLQQMAEKEDLLFVGNVEGRDVFRGAVDVLVTDGFTGNILLKTSEGVSSFILHQLEGILRQIAPEKEIPILKKLQSTFDYEEHSGAIICGIDGVAVKCHGQSSWKGLLRGIEGAIQLVQNRFIDQIKQQLAISQATL